MAEKIRFYSCLGLLQAVPLFFLKHTFNRIYSFRITKTASFFLRIAGMFGSVELFKYALADMRDKNGQTYYVRFRETQQRVCNRISADIMNDSRAFISLSGLFTPGRFKDFFGKIIYCKIEKTILFLNVIEWYCNQKRIPNNSTELVVERDFYLRPLEDFVKQEYGIRLQEHFSLRRSLFWLFSLCGKDSLLILFECMHCFFNGSYVSDKDNAGHSADIRQCSISALYTLKGLTFNPAKRCDFPWLLVSDDLKKRCIIYFEREDIPADRHMAEILEREHIRGVALSKKATVSEKVPVFRKSARFAGIMFRLFCRVIPRLIRERNARACGHEILCFLKEYARAYDFYKTYNIKINIDFAESNPYKVARTAALEDTGGISIGYQVSNWNIPSILLSSSADVFFMFGGYYFDIFKRSGGCSNTVVICGYLSDYSFNEVTDYALALRKKLSENGAEFILAYFDENSSDSPESIIPHNQSSAIYRKLLNWLDEDHTLGLICSPKRPRTLLQRMPELAPCIQKAESTGRCIFMDGAYAADNYPAEVAKASDVTLCLLLGGTVSLEGHLSGARVVNLDLESLYSYPEYLWGKGTILFEKMEEVQSAIKAYRSRKQEFLRLGSAEEVLNLKLKDPFRDGKARLRMAEYLQHLLEMLDDGKTRGEAIAYANKLYSEKWGARHVLN